MKINSYKVTLINHRIWHQRFIFIGERPTRNDVLEAIERWRNDRFLHDDMNTAQYSKDIVENCDWPTGDGGVLDQTEWRMLGEIVGNIQITKEDAWTKETP